jgi:hypothetical protein
MSHSLSLVSDTLSFGLHQLAGVLHDLLVLLHFEHVKVHGHFLLIFHFRVPDIYDVKSLQGV